MLQASNKWDHSSFTKNRERLLGSDIVVKFFTRIRAQARQKGLLSDEHFTVDGTLIEAWAGRKAFSPRTGITELLEVRGWAEMRISTIGDRSTAMKRTNPRPIRRPGCIKKPVGRRLC